MSTANPLHLLGGLNVALAQRHASSAVIPLLMPRFHYAAHPFGREAIL